MSKRGKASEPFRHKWKREIFHHRVYQVGELGVGRVTSACETRWTLRAVFRPVVRMTGPLTTS
ncbi:hypothetical protein B0H10DRAFT_2076805 [Mycena sp. CBHHK59/15]|nr:hypothetical protein B0H10DRAFT_2076805 [Mycena sp. CBHHK59/15]